MRRRSFLAILTTPALAPLVRASSWVPVLFRGQFLGAYQRYPLLKSNVCVAPRVLTEELLLKAVAQWRRER